MDTDPGSAPEKKDNHLHFQDRIEVLAQEIDGAGMLLSRIKGLKAEAVQKDKETDMAPLSLEKFLSEGGEIITNLTNRLREIRKEIQDVLFQ